ncbi:MAG: polyprenyl synthetase family protein [Bifidobacteriaceae bacterium]|jgi:geranylgeranyl pyrophosphate synthase|nr:polyprenyl synthetase family protein [Bifidobacteriaceae bacterium]
MSIEIPNPYGDLPSKNIRSAILKTLVLIHNIDNFDTDFWGKIIEDIHTASLYHDDIIDSATTRRAAPSLNYVTDDKTAVLAGDYLLTNTISLAYNKNPLSVGVILDTFKKMVEGEYLELDRVKNSDSDCFEKYIETLELKTSELFVLIGSIINVVNSNEIITKDELLFLKNFGTVFQIIDDANDLEYKYNLFDIVLSNTESEYIIKFINTLKSKITDVNTVKTLGNDKELGINTIFDFISPEELDDFIAKLFML